jgi:hypothetical protein
MTIDELYRFVQLIANKEQRGFIKPSEFNLLAQQAQLDLIHDRVARYKTESEAMSKGSKVLVQNHSVLDDIRSVVFRKQLSYAGLGVWKYPENEMGSDGKMSGEYLHFLRLYHIPGAVSPDADEVQPGVPHTNDDGGEPNKELLRGKIDLITHDQLSYRLHSELIYPDRNNYIAVMFDKGFEIYGFEGGLNDDGIQNEIAELKTSDYKKIYLVYIAKPPSPHWGYTMVNNQYIYNPSNDNTQQLTLPSKTHREIAQRMLSYIGISLRDQEPLNYAEAKVKEQSASSPSVGRPRISPQTPQRRR